MEVVWESFRGLDMVVVAVKVLGMVRRMFLLLVEVWMSLGREGSDQRVLRRGWHDLGVGHRLADFQVNLWNQT